MYIYIVNIYNIRIVFQYAKFKRNLRRVRPYFKFYFRPILFFLKQIPILKKMFGYCGAHLFHIYFEHFISENLEAQPWIKQNIIALMQYEAMIRNENKICKKSYCKKRLDKIARCEIRYYNIHSIVEIFRSIRDTRFTSNNYLLH